MRNAGKGTGGPGDPVTVGVALPKGTKGLTITKITIAKGQATGKITITATDKATIGDLALNVEATLKLQGQTIKVTLPLIAPLEAELGVPIVTSNQATLWAMLRAVGIEDRGPGGGRLLAGA